MGIALPEPLSAGLQNLYLTAFFVLENVFQYAVRHIDSNGSPVFRGTLLRRRGPMFHETLRELLYLVTTFHVVEISIEAARPKCESIPKMERGNIRLKGTSAWGYGRREITGGPESQRRPKVRRNPMLLFDTRRFQGISALDCTDDMRASLDGAVARRAGVRVRNIRPRKARTADVQRTRQRNEGRVVGGVCGRLPGPVTGHWSQIEEHIPGSCRPCPLLWLSSTQACGGE